MTVDCFAVRVKNISKMYHLWHSPRTRLMFPVHRLLKKNHQNSFIFVSFKAK